MAISEGGSTEDLHLTGIYNQSDFVLSGDAPGGASGGTEVVYAGPQTLTITVDALSGYNFQNVDPIAQMGSGTLLNAGGTAASFTLVDAADDLQFVVDGTNFTYANGAVTGGVITAIHEFTDDSTPAAIADFTGIAENAVAWLAAAQQEAAGNKTPFHTLTANFSFDFNGSAATGTVGFGSGPNADTLTGGAGNDFLDSGGAPAGSHDTLTGGAGSDTFVYQQGYGAVTITDFDQGNSPGVFDPSEHDKLEINGFGGNPNPSFGHDAQGNLLVEFGGGDVLTLVGVQNSSQIPQADIIGGGGNNGGGGDNGGGNNGGPVITGANNSVTYTGTPAFLDQSVAVTDSTGTVSSVNVWIDSGFQSGDTLSINGNGDGTLDYGADGSIHYHFGYSNTGQPSIFLSAFTGTPSAADFDAALQLIQFSPGAADGDRTVLWAAYDNVVHSATPTTTVHVGPILNSMTLTVSEGGTTVLSSSDFHASDPGFTDLTYTVGSVTGGQFEVFQDGSWQSAPTGGFTNTQIADGDVEFVQNGSATAPTFSIHVSDSGPNASPDISPTVTFISAPTLTIANHNLAVAQNGSVPLGISEAPATSGDPVLVTISGIPSDATLTDSNNDTLTISNGSITLTQAQLSGLSLQSGVTSGTLTVTAQEIGPSTVNFDAINTSGGPVGGAAVASYLAGYGITLSVAGPGAGVSVASQNQVYDGGIVEATSGSNVITEGATGGSPVSYTLTFAKPLSSFAFDQVIENGGPSGSSYAAWSATAYDAAGDVVSTVGDPNVTTVSAGSSDPAVHYTLTGPDIASVTFSGNAEGAGFANIVTDTWVLTPEATAMNSASQTIALNVSSVPSGTVSADQYVWGGSASGSWDVAANWNDTTAALSPASVAPGSNDSVTIHAAESGATVISGTGDSASLTIDGSTVLTGAFTTGALTVADSETLQLNSGGTLTVAGTFTSTNDTIDVRNDSSVQLAGLTLGTDSDLASDGITLVVDGGSPLGNPFFTGNTSSVEIGTLGNAAAGSITIDAGVTVTEVGAFEAPDIVVNGTLVVAEGGSLTLNGSLGGNGQIEIGSGANLTVEGGAGASGSTATIAFEGTGDTLTIASNALGGSFPAIGGLNASDAIVFQGTVTGTSYDSGSGILTLLDNGNAVAELTLSGSYAGATFYTVAVASGVTQIGILGTGDTGSAPSGNSPGDQYVWGSSIAGSWDVASNWNDTTAGLNPALAAPGSNDSVTIDAADGGAAHVISGTGDSAALTIDGPTVLAAGQFSTGTLTVADNEMLQLNAGDTLTVTGDASIGQLNGPVIGGILDVVGTLHVDGNLFLGLERGAIVGDTVNGGSLTAGSLTSNGSHVDISGGGHFLVAGDVTETFGGSSYSVNGSTLTVDGTLTSFNDSIFAIDGSTVQLAGLALGTDPTDGIAIQVDDFGSPFYSGVGTSSVEIGTLGNAAVGSITIDAGITVTEAGSFEAADIVDNGILVAAAGGSLTLDGSLGGSGQIEIGSGANLTVEGGAGAIGSTAAIAFDGSGGTLTIAGSALDGSLNFVPTISGFDASDSINFQGTITNAIYNNGVLTLFDNGNVVANLNLSGNYTGDTFNTSADTVTLTVNPSAANSSITASPTTVLADGTSTTTLTVTAKDAAGDLMSGATVTLSATGTGNSFAPVSGVTDANGVFTATLDSSVVENETVQAVIGGTVDETVQVNFVAEHWTNASGGSWTTAGNWNYGVPNSNDAAVIDASGTYTVISSASASVTALTTIATATLSVTAGTLTVTGTGTSDLAGAVINSSTISVQNGTLELDNTVANTGGTLAVGTGAFLNLNAATVTGGNIADNGTIDVNGLVSLNSGVTFDGTGLSGKINNAGTIKLTGSTGVGIPALTLAGSGITLELDGTGTLNLNGKTLGNTASGDTLINNGNTISGTGKIGTGMGGTTPLSVNNESGIIEAVGGVLSISNGTFLANSGLLEAATGGTLDFTIGGIHNNGTNPLASSHASGILVNNILEVDNPTASGAELTLGGLGDGVMVLNNGTVQGNSSNAETFDNLNNLISGAGNIGVSNNGVSVDLLTLKNDAAGTIDANVSGHFLNIHTGANAIVNAGTLEATDGGVLDINSALTNSGLLTASDGGILSLTNETITNTGTIDVDGSIAASQLIIHGTLTLEGGNGSSTGPGQVIMTGGLSNAILSDLNAATFENVDNTISGSGSIGDAHLTVLNDAYGVIDATGVLTLDAASLTNSGILEATGGGKLVVDDDISGAGNIHVGANSTVELADTSANSVTFDGAQGTLQIDSSGTSTAFSVVGNGTAIPIGDVIDLPNIQFDAAADSYDPNTDTITVGDGAGHNVTIHVVGGIGSGNDFTFQVDATGGTSLVDPSASGGHVGGVIMNDPGPAASQIVATAPNQTLTGTGASNSFVFNFANIGHDTVTDFHPGTDTLQFGGAIFANPQAALNATQDDGHGNTVITLDAHDARNHPCPGVIKAQLHAADFHF